MIDNAIQPRLFSGSRSQWTPRVIIRNSELAVIGEVDVDSSAPSLPSLESLQRRYESSDKGWARKWLAAADDPRRPL